MSEQTSDEKYLLQSVNNALAIIDVLCEHDNLGLAELASYMNLGKSTVFSPAVYTAAQGLCIQGPEFKVSFKLQICPHRNYCHQTF